METFACYEYAWVIRTAVVVGITVMGIMNCLLAAWVYMRQVRIHEDRREPYNIQIMLDEST